MPIPLLLSLLGCALFAGDTSDKDDTPDEADADTDVDTDEDTDGGDTDTDLDTDDGGDCAGAFADAPRSWTLPSGYGTGAFVATAGAMDCSTDAPAFVTTDLTGDGAPDIVVTRACDDSAVGTTHWRVYAGGASGFASTPSVWTLPTGYGTAAFVATAGTMDCAADAPSYTLADLDGDDAAELVVTRACDDATVGTRTWRVYANTGSGFGAAANWTLPTGYGDAAFVATAGVMTCADDAPSFFLADLEGDHVPDIVVTQACDDATVGTDAWRVHRGGSRAFGAATTWALPGDYGDAAFITAAAGMSCAALRPAYTLADLDGDDATDLVVTQACDDTGVGVTSWRRYPNTGAGFGGVEAWGLPGGYGSLPFPAAAGAMTCATGQPSFQVATLDGSSDPALLVTRACDDATVGTSAWRVHPGGLLGFVEAESWTLPAGYGTAAFVGTSGVMDCAADAPSFVTTDLDGSGVADIVVTRACNDATVGTTSWRVHAGGCG